MASELACGHAGHLSHRTAILAIEQSLVVAINPWQWLQVMRAVRTDAQFLRFLLLQIGLFLLGIMSIYLGTGFFGRLLIVAATLIAAVLVFRALGIIMHANAEALGMPVTFGKKQVDDAREAQIGAELGEFTTALYALCLADRHAEAMQKLETHLSADRFRSEGRIFDTIRAFDDPRLGLKAGQGYIGRLVAAQDLRRAWAVLSFCFEENGGRYALLTGDVVIKLANSAMAHSEKAIAAHLLCRFDTDFPRHPLAGKALLAGILLVIEQSSDLTGARELFARVASGYPQLRRSRNYRTAKKLLEG
jgi:hypothetical protein